MLRFQYELFIISNVLVGLPHQLDAKNRWLKCFECRQGVPIIFMISSITQHMRCLHSVLFYQNLHDYATLTYVTGHKLQIVERPLRHALKFTKQSCGFDISKCFLKLCQIFNTQYASKYACRMALLIKMALMVSATSHARKHRLTECKVVSNYMDKTLLKA